MNFTGQQCPSCGRGTVVVVHSNSGGWYWGCSRFGWNRDDACRAAWNQRGEPYGQTARRLRRSFWQWLLG